MMVVLLLSFSCFIKLRTGTWSELKWQGFYWMFRFETSLRPFCSWSCTNCVAVTGIVSAELFLFLLCRYFYPNFWCFLGISVCIQHTIRKFRIVYWILKNPLCHINTYFMLSSYLYRFVSKKMWVLYGRKTNIFYFKKNCLLLPGRNKLDLRKVLADSFFLLLYTLWKGL